MYQGITDHPVPPSYNPQSATLPEPTHAQKIMDLQGRVMQLESQVGELLRVMVATVGADLKI